MAGRTSKTSSAPRKRWRNAARRWLLPIALGVPALVIGLWIAVHRVEWLGPLVANTLRALVGTDNVAKLEDSVYAVEDRFNRIWRKGEKPKAYWQVPSAETKPLPAEAVPNPKAPQYPPFRPTDVGPMHKSWSAEGDGMWVAIKDSRRPAEQPHLYKTLLHPDRNRSWAELFVVAVDLRLTELRIMAGRSEPKSTEKDAQSYNRIAHVPEAQQAELLAAFNGGFMTEHGNYGMKVDEIVLVKPRENACTIAAYKDGSLRIGSWKNLKDAQADMTWYRQAPACMYEAGKLHPGLQAGASGLWGATLDGETVIRRSAVGLNATRDVLFVGISNHTTAPAIATGMFHAGATDVAQLDVNWSYPKFVLFEPAEAGPARNAVALAPGFEFSEDEYIRKRSIRDFFYLLRKAPSARAAQN